MTKNNTTEGKHGWNENGGVYHCSDGEHPSWWLSIAKTPQWKAWYRYASENMLYDVAECERCGWMSEEHAKDFLAFIDSQAHLQERKDTLERCLELLPKEKNDLPNRLQNPFYPEGNKTLKMEGNINYMDGFNSCRSQAESAIKEEIKKQATP